MLSLNRKITKNKSDHLLALNELNELKTFDSSCFIGKGHFEEHGLQNYLVFQPIIRYFKVNTIVNVADYVLSWKSKGLSDESIKPPSTSNNAHKIREKFTGSCLKQDKITYTHKK